MPFESLNETLLACPSIDAYNIFEVGTCVISALIFENLLEMQRKLCDPSAAISY